MIAAKAWLYAIFPTLRRRIPMKAKGGDAGNHKAISQAPNHNPGKGCADMPIKS